MPYSPNQDESDPRCAFYNRSLTALKQAGVPFLVGGAIALEHYTGITRWTKDLDIFVYPKDCKRVLKMLSASDCRVEFTHPHWLGKAFCGDEFIDVIFGSGNGVCVVDDIWFEHAVVGETFGVTIGFAPPEEIIWQKAFIMERERYDGADIMHVLRACGGSLDWRRLLDRFGQHWRVLLSHLVLFGFIYPDERTRIPDWVMDELLNRLQNERNDPAPDDRICQGTLLSRVQYKVDIERWAYKDARLVPEGKMTAEEIARWDEASFEEND